MIYCTNIIVILIVTSLFIYNSVLSYLNLDHYKLDQINKPNKPNKQVFTCYKRILLN